MAKHMELVFINTCRIYRVHNIRTIYVILEQVNFDLVFCLRIMMEYDIDLKPNQNSFKQANTRAL